MAPRGHVRAGDINRLNDTWHVAGALDFKWRLETHTLHLSWGEASITLEDVAYHTGLCTAEELIGGCMPLLVSWIYHRFSCFSPAGYDVVRFPLASWLARLAQQSKDHHDGRILSLHHRIDALTFK
ncbi:hypothetical protein AHAS_Ahas04G0157000 [Arachis hypogaea]